MSNLSTEHLELKARAASALRRSLVLYARTPTAATRRAYYQAIQEAASDQILTPREIQQAAQIRSRQRYHQILHTPSIPPIPPASEQEPTP